MTFFKNPSGWQECASIFFIDNTNLQNITERVTKNDGNENKTLNTFKSKKRLKKDLEQF